MTLPTCERCGTTTTAIDKHGSLIHCPRCSSDVAALIVPALNQAKREANRFALLATTLMFFIGAALWTGVILVLVLVS